MTLGSEEEENLDIFLDLHYLLPEYKQRYQFDELKEI